MKTNEIFALLLRIIGVVCLIYVARNTINCHPHGSIPADGFYWITRVLYFGLGAYMIRGAPLLVKFAFPEKSNPAEARKAQ